MPPGHAGEFAHNGANEGFQGVAIVANSNNGVPVAREYVRSLAKEYGWEFLPEARGPGQELMMVAKLNVYDSRDEAYAAAGKKSWWLPIMRGGCSSIR